MWSTFNTAKMWGKRPSEMLAIGNDYYAYCLDEVVTTWGTFITNELDKVEGKTDKQVHTKRHNKLLQLLDAPVQQRFRALRKPTPKK